MWTNLNKLIDPFFFGRSDFNFGTFTFFSCVMTNHFFLAGTPLAMCGTWVKIRGGTRSTSTFHPGTVHPDTFGYILSRYIPSEYILYEYILYRLNVMVDVDGKEAEGLRGSAAAVVACLLTSQEQVNNSTHEVESVEWKIALLDNPREMMLPSSSGRGSWASSNSCPGGEGVDNLEERQWGTNYSSLQPLLLHAQSLVNSCLKHLNCSCLTLPSLNLTSPKPLHWWTRSFVYCPWFLLLCWCVHLEPLLLFDQINDSVTSKAQRVPNTWCFRFNFLIDSCDEALLHSQCTIFFSSRLSGLVFLPCFYSYLYICSWLCWTRRDDFIQFNCISTHISIHISTFFSW